MKLVKLLEKYFDKVIKNKEGLFLVKKYRTIMIPKNKISLIKTNFDLSSLIKKKFIRKNKMCITLKKQIVDQNKHIETFFKDRGWIVTNAITETYMFFNHFTEEPMLDYIYEVKINNKKHLILNDEVYEGDLNFINSIGERTALEVFLHLIDNDKEIISILNKMDKSV